MHKDNGFIENCWFGGSSVSGHDFYKINDGKLDFVERISLDAWHALDVGIIKDRTEANENNCFFVSPSDQFDDYKLVSYDEAMEKIEAYKKDNKELIIEYTLLSEYKNHMLKQAE